ncbi:MAG: hypothetical protein Q4D16_16525 [Eubacteriales bacterium]|nr:hypothetical protein [Eubacteriales bacterium]
MPKPLFTKLVAQGAIGFFCVLFGCAYGLHSKDKVLLILSLGSGVGSLIRCISLYRIIHSQHYLYLEGTCTKREPTLLKRNLQILFQDKAGTEYRFTLDKGVKLLQGHYYRLYFRTDKPDGKTVPVNAADTLQDFLGFEELTSVAPEKSSEIT